MSEIQEVRAFVRRDRLPAVLRALRAVGASRFYVTEVHAHGAGVDPDDVRYSLEEEEAYTVKAKIEILCEGDRMAEITATIREAGSTGHRGDGIIAVRQVGEVVSIRTGDREGLALL